MKKNKKLLTAAVVLSAAAFSSTAHAETRTVNLQINNPEMTVNGVVSELDSPPVIIDSRTLVPIRAIVEALDGEVDWNNTTKTAALTSSKGDEVKLTINSKTASYNGVESELDTPPVIINERTMLPIRFVAESFGYKTDWNAADKSITISDGEEDTETEQVSFDLEGYEQEHLANDTSGNEYVLFFNEDDIYDKFIAVKDSSNTAASNRSSVYKLTNAWGNVYKDNSGNMFTLVYNDKEEKYSVIVNGKEKDAALNDEYYLVDEDGNVYTYSEDDKIIVKDKSGKVLGEYSETGEMWDTYADESGNKAYNVHKRNGGYKDGFIYPDGKYAEFEYSFDNAFMGSDGRIYGMQYEYIIVADKNYNIIEEFKEVPNSVDEIYIAKDGTEYIVTGDLAESYTLSSGDRSIKLTCDPEEEHNKKLFDSGSYGSDDTIYYNGDDGRIYAAKDYIFTVYGTDGKEEDKIAMSRYEEKYRSSNGKTFIYIYSYSDDKAYIKTDSDTVQLDEIFG